MGYQKRRRAAAAGTQRDARVDLRGTRPTRRARTKEPDWHPAPAPAPAAACRRRTCAAGRAVGNRCCRVLEQGRPAGLCVRGRERRGARGDWRRWRAPAPARTCSEAALRLAPLSPKGSARPSSPFDMVGWRPEDPAAPARLKPRCRAEPHQGSACRPLGPQRPPTRNVIAIAQASQVATLLLPVRRDPAAGGPCGESAHTSPSRQLRGGSTKTRFSDWLTCPRRACLLGLSRLPSTKKVCSLGVECPACSRPAGNARDRCFCSTVREDRAVRNRWPRGYRAYSPPRAWAAALHTSDHAPP